MTAHNRRLKVITLDIGGTQFEAQISSWTLDPGIQDGERQYTYVPDGEFVEDADNEPTLALTFFSDWRSNGLNDYLWEHNGEVAAFTLDHHPDIPAEHVRFTGSVKLRPGPVGGDVRTTETTEVTLPLQGDPVFERVGA
ncbi:hypothetical protein [Amycolatopsis thermoflava]|uniref:hypothetical protein n=1 Tax=Amycolatopsis thermoflava TaxID=84480 RepID=UPI0036627A0E